MSGMAGESYQFVVNAYDADASEPEKDGEPTYFAQDLAAGIEELTEAFVLRFGEPFDPDELQAVVIEALELALTRCVSGREEKRGEQ